MGPTNIKFVGSPCGQHGPYTFYKAFKFKKDSKTSILSLGEFFFVKIFKDVEVCIGELQLLWEDRYNSGSYLCMVRLYFLPEQTPEGRKPHHGEDEVVMESDKVPLLVEDLVSLLATDIEWTAGTPAINSSLVDGHSKALPELRTEASDFLRTLEMCNKGLDMRDINQERKTLGKQDESEVEHLGSEVVILNYPQYCRFRAMSKRLAGCKEGWLNNLLVAAIGGMNLILPSTKILFCRDMFEHPVIQEHEMRQDHLAPNLRGRPKKKRMNFRKYEKDHVYSNDSDSGDSYSSSEKSSSQSIPLKIKDKGSPVPSKEEKPIMPVKPLVVKSPKAPVKVKKEISEEDLIDIRPFKPSGDLTKEEERFLKKLGLFMKKSNIKICRLPTLGFKPVNLCKFYLLTSKLGGYEQVTEKRKWKHIYDKLGGSPGNTSAATCTRRHYEKFLLNYEKHLKGIGGKMIAPVASKNKTIKTELVEVPSSNDVKPVQNSFMKKKIKDLMSKEDPNVIKKELQSMVTSPTLNNVKQQVISVLASEPLAQSSSLSTAQLPTYISTSASSQANSIKVSVNLPGQKLLNPKIKKEFECFNIDKIRPTPEPAHKPKPLPYCGTDSKPQYIKPAHTVKKDTPLPVTLLTGPMEHFKCYQESRTKPSCVKFLNAPPMQRNVYATHIVYGEPFMKQSYQPNELTQMKRCISLGKSNMNLNLVTPPPAHCNPNKSSQAIVTGKKRPNHLTVQKNLNQSNVVLTGNHRLGATPGKKPRLVSDYVALNASPKIPNVRAASLTQSQRSKQKNAPPANPFVTKQQGGGLTLPHIPTTIGHPQVEFKPINVSINNRQFQTFTSNTAIGNLPIAGSLSNGSLNSTVIMSPSVCSTSNGLEIPKGDQNLVVNTANLLSKFSPGAQSSTIIPVVAMQSNVVSINPNSFVSMAPSSLAVTTNAILRPLVAIPNNNVLTTNVASSSANCVPVIREDVQKAKQPQQLLPRVITPKAGDPPPITSQVHPAFINGTVSTVPSSVVLPGKVTPQTLALPSPTTPSLPLAGMLSYMIPIQQMQQLYQTTPQPPAATATVTSSSQ